MTLATFLVQCLNSLQYGLLLFLVASGLTLIFGIMGVINLAHGSFYMIGAYMAYALAPLVAATLGGGFFTTLLVGLVLAVLLGYVLEWAFFSFLKSSGDKQLDLALVHLLGAAAALPLLLWVGLPPVAAWPFIGLSLLIHIAYYVTLNGAYQHGDLGRTYPIMRGSAPLLVALGSTTVLGEQLSPAGLARHRRGDRRRPDGRPGAARRDAAPPPRARLRAGQCRGDHDLHADRRQRRAQGRRQRG